MRNKRLHGLSRRDLSGLTGPSIALVALFASAAAGCAQQGADGACTVEQHADGSATITCPDGSQATVPPGDDGEPGPSAPAPGLAMSLSLSPPANGTHYVAGEQVTV